MFGGLFGRFQWIAERPMLGRARPELGEDVRSLIGNRYFIFYRARATGGVSILRIIHQSQDIPGTKFVARA